MPKPPLKTEEKLDLILKYTRSTRHWAVFRGIISFLFFLIFVVLPIIGSVYLYKYIKDFDPSVFTNMQGQFEEFKNFGDSLSKFGGAFKP